MRYSAPLQCGDLPLVLRSSVAAIGESISSAVEKLPIKSK